MHKDYRIDTSNYKEVYKNLQTELESIQKHSNENIFYQLGRVFKIDFIRDSQEDLIELYQSDKITAENKEILKNLIIFSNLPILFNIVHQEILESTGGVVKQKYSNIELEDIYSDGIILMENAIRTFDSKNKGKYIPTIVKSELADDKLTLFLDGKNKHKNLTVIAGDNQFDLVVSNDGKIEIDIRKIKDEVFLKDVLDKREIKFVTTSMKDLDSPYIILEGKKTKFTTHLTTVLKYGIKKELLKSNGIKLTSDDNVFLNKINFGRKLYNTILENSNFTFYGDCYSIEQTQEKKETDKYHDDYYDTILIKDKSIEKKYSVYSEASTRWLAFFLLTQNKKFQIVPVDDKFELFISEENEIQKKEDIYQCNYEFVNFTENSEKRLKTIENNITQLLLNLNFSNTISMSRETDDENEELDFEDKTESLSETFQKREDSKKLIKGIKKYFDNIIFETESKEQMIEIYQIFTENGDEEEIILQFGKDLFKEFKRYFEKSFYLLKKELVGKYGEESLSAIL